MNKSFIDTLKTNWRDLAAFVVIGLTFACSSGILDWVATYYSESKFASLILPGLANYLKGFANFTGAAVTSTLLWMWAWPTINKFGNYSFSAAWESLKPEQQFATYIALILGALISAAICFS